MIRRRHHNTDGRRRTQRGKRHAEVAAMARRLGVPSPSNGDLLLPKGPTRRQLKSRRKRADDAAMKAVRLLALERDGRCWFATHRQGTEWIHCQGLPELMHLPPRTRAQTRNMPPEYRHDIRYVAMGCTYHHARVDGRVLPKLTIPTPLEG